MRLLCRSILEKLPRSAEASLPLHCPNTSPACIVELFCCTAMLHGLYMHMYLMTTRRCCFIFSAHNGSNPCVKRHLGLLCHGQPAFLVSQADADVLEGRKRLQAKWDEWRESRKEYAKELADGQRNILEQFYDLSQQDEYSIEEVETETQLSSNEEVIRSM